MHLKQYNTFKVLGIFLWYPEEAWLADSEKLYDIIKQEKLLSAEDTKVIRTFVTDISTKDIFAAQEEYVDTFDRIRSLSLHLFEHVHGESRDRGQAMVDLSEVYKEKGMVLAKSELPDYLPVFLEYLSLIPKHEALEMLSEPMHILMEIGKRLAELGSPYASVFSSLIRLGGSIPAKVTKVTAFKNPSFEEIDKEWEDKPIEFLNAESPKSVSCGGGGCSGTGGCGGSSKQPGDKLVQGVGL